MRAATTIVLMLLAAGAARAQSANITWPGWLAGCWAIERGDRTTLEMWMPPAGGMMLGASRTVVNGATREYEQLMLREAEGRLVYVANPSGQAETAFTTTAVTDSSFTVENLAHDFPQRLVYRRVGSDSLAVRVEGGGRGFELRLGRVACALIP